MKNDYIQNSHKIYLVLGLVAFAILFRCFSIWPNLSPLLAGSLLVGSRFKSFGLGVWTTLSILLISDLYLGFHETMPYVYAPFLLMAVLAKYIRRDSVVSPMSFATGGSVLFFVISNFGVWFSTPLYSKTFDGLIECYVSAIPFYRWTLLGDLVFTAAIFSIFNFVESKCTLSECPALKRTGK